MTEPSKQNIRAVSRALAVLNSFTQKRSQTLADVTNATGLDKGTTRRLLITLMDNGYVAQDPTTQQYRIGRALRLLAADVPDGFDLRAVASPVLTQLASEFPVTAFVSVYDDGDVVCLDRIHDMKGIEVHWWAVGGTLPYNCGGAPKLLLAFQPVEEIERVLTREPTAMTRASITDRGALRDRFAQIRQQDYEFAVDDVTLGLTALAVPVRTPDGSIAGAISIAGLTPQLCNEDGPDPLHLGQLREAARQIERRIQMAGAA
ncbi:IclR family transcriptional regulator [Acuticoccus sediminis]|uniref:IclR family transcriptional regulator n=1 Tax=Acuticoccus sediminis TaxID=2184697 RepID=A0A8B2NMB5_9HYPH|nr:IclR family transcriptional regulator [Acuticoccus sediminis]RAI00816.1 IclR family transcriptional regulator [Acuticoccus sediminis]